ncbi:MAG: hypothetical protein ACPH9Q_08600, partial [Schleiferiaceae bacterium]
AKTQNHIEALAATTEAVAVKIETGEVPETKEVGLIAEIKEILITAQAEVEILKKDPAVAKKMAIRVNLVEILVTD